ncbi:MAG: HlyD family efflux transporter periplasmic adaptor subunit, partial [Thiotrichaceae bacterium]|nr:HlyD family efflux transporter periplasmic adaptor subunit [Thiotrichaceae bacterium]
GILRSVFFLLATTTWIMSILVNFNPLMRFDGYYLLSDWLRMPNLESRSFAMAKWWLRENLFALNAPPPEPIKLKLVFFAYSVWIYRFFLFLGIALLVYYFFFKVLGLLLFTIEIIYFIVRPIMTELKEWRGFWSQVTWNKTTVRGCILLLMFIALFFIPWRSSIESAAFIKAQYTPLYAPVSGKISLIAFNNKQHLQDDEIVIEMDVPELSYERQQGQRRYQELSWQRAVLGFDSKMRSEALIVTSALFTQNRRLRGLIGKHDKRILRAPNAGVVADLDTEIKVGDWIAEGTAVLSVVNTQDLTVHAYLEEEYLSRVEVGQTGYFYPEKGNYPVFDVEIEEIDGMAVRSMDALYSASLFGGDVAVRENGNKNLVPVISVYKVRLKLLDQLPDLQRVMRGTVVLKGTPKSFFKRIKNRMYAAFRREGGF